LALIAEITPPDLSAAVVDIRAKPGAKTNEVYNQRVMANALRAIVLARKARLEYSSCVTGLSSDDADEDELLGIESNAHLLVGDELRYEKNLLDGEKELRKADDGFKVLVIDHSKEQYRASLNLSKASLSTSTRRSIMRPSN
jgi:hypothetical protein